MFNTDGFNDRITYVRNSNDNNNVNRTGPSNSDSSFAKMKIDENKPTINTVNNDAIITEQHVRGNRENFVLRNNNINNLNRKNMINRNLFSNRFNKK